MRIQGFGRSLAMGKNRDGAQYDNLEESMDCYGDQDEVTGLVVGDTTLGADDDHAANHDDVSQDGHGHENGDGMPRMSATDGVEASSNGDGFDNVFGSGFYNDNITHNSNTPNSNNNENPANETNTSDLTMSTLVKASIPKASSSTPGTAPLGSWRTNKQASTVANSFDMEVSTASDACSGETSAAGGGGIIVGGAEGGDGMDPSGSSLLSTSGVMGKQPMPRRRKVAILVAMICVVTLGITLGVALMIGMSSNSGNSNGSNGFDFDKFQTSVPTSLPSRMPSITPSTSRPSSIPSELPSSKPSSIPSVPPSSIPSSVPSAPPSSTPSQPPSPQPSTLPSFVPTRVPTRTPTTSTPTARPTSTPTRAPTQAPTTGNPTSNPTAEGYEPIGQLPTPRDPLDQTTLSTVCVIADVPYFDDEEIDLPIQIAQQTGGCEFMIHLGDIMSAADRCDGNKFTQVRAMLINSAIPVFIVPGDNEWNDCGNQAGVDLAWRRWKTNFMRLEDNWSHNFGVVRHAEYPENFAFIHKHTLFIGLKVVGGNVHDRGEWRRRHAAEIWWIQQLVKQNIPNKALGVVVMAHATPNRGKHANFFDPLKEIVRNELGRQYPLLYLHGDGHNWTYDTSFLNTASALRVQHEGGTRDPVLKMLVDPKGQGLGVGNAFQFDRQLHLERLR